MTLVKANQRKPRIKPLTKADSKQDTHTPHGYHMQGYHPHPPADKPKRKSALWLILVIIILALVFVYASLQLILYFVHSRQAKLEEQQVHTMILESQEISAQEAALTATPTTLPQTIQPVVSRHESVDAQPPQVLIQFQSALFVNPDTVGQLQLGESIRTYVVQRDNTYYLRHSFSGETSVSGAIFLDVTCSVYPQSRNLIIHGHNMQDGTAFGKLSRYDSLSYLNRYPFIEFSTLYECARYIPFAAVYYSVDPASDDYLDIYRINAMSADEFTAFVSKVQRMSEYLLPVYLRSIDKILTLTTCATGDDDMRFALFAVKHNEL